MVFLSAQAQPQLTGKLKGFTVSPEFYTNSSQMKSLLKGAEAEPLPGGQIRLKEARLQTFHTNGTKELLVIAPDCLFDSNAKMASSPGPLEAATADGRFAMAGVGFAYEQNAACLQISNQVKTTVQVEALNAAEIATSGANPRPAKNTLIIESDRFWYSRATGLGTYSGHVKVAGTNLALTAETLTIKVPFENRKFQTVTAEDQVHIHYGDIYASGQTADYDANSGLLHLQGNPIWEAQGRKGGADNLIMDHTNRTFLAQGNAWLKLPGQTLGDFNLERGPTNRPSAKASTNQFIEIHAPAYTFHTNYALFGEPVRVEQFQDDASQMALTCEQLTARFAGTNELQSILAERQVRMEQKANLFTAGAALFTATNQLVRLTENPRWESGTRKGSADLLLLDGAERAMLARGKAVMILPASELASSGLAFGPNRTNAQPEHAQAPAQITCEEYRLSEENAWFHDHVRLQHPQMNWECERLHVQIPPAGGRVERLVAEDSVSFDLLDARGQKLTGRGEKAVYNYSITEAGTNDLLELTGNPVLQTTNGTFNNPVFLLNLGTGKLVAPGSYKMQGEIPGKDTNLFRFPQLTK